MALLLEKFMENPAQAQYEATLQLGLLDEVSAQLFALVVFICDELLQIKPAAAFTSATPALEHAAAAASRAVRFFTIAYKLPIELQMVLCHRAVGSMKQNILSKDSEHTFKSLAVHLVLSEREEVS